MYKNSNSAKALLVTLGRLVVASGLALPAYGQAETVFAPNQCVANAQPMAGRADGGMASSFATGCNADAQTSGSITAGENAVVESYDVVTPAVPNEAAQYAVRDITNSGMIHEDVEGTVNAEAGTITLTRAHPVLGAIGTVVPIPPEMDSLLSLSITRPAMPGSAAIPATSETRGANGIAVGNGANVRGTGSIAIGAGAQVSELITPAVPAMPEIRGPVTRAVAIGVDSSVTGDNGIAIGAGVTAGANQIVIGQDGQRAFVGGVDLAAVAANTRGINNVAAASAAADTTLAGGGLLTLSK